MIKKTTFAVLALGAALGTTLGVAHAQHGPGFWRHDPLLAGVTLTDAQQQKIDALNKSDRHANKSLFQQVRAIDKKIDAALLTPGPVSEANLAPLVQQKAALMAQLDSARLSQEIAVRNLLTDDQLAIAAATRAKLDSLREQERALHAASATPSAAPAGN
ncbi:Spy/CpxP family protein refolding chaperone [Acetobacteraceae bacterium KSS8]|uniref:Spy/CpxP family protein refolding chaperone n=1 Tax=Endosaccharibacter trunci TaxID=2812733 RepID=A0ABT1W4R9_9PROT|nr:Spy/CpxP family protein refolding chaperone [Acetobacteraceae bacterium KSS8]